MGIFKNVINQIKEGIKSDLNDTKTLSSEEKKLDSILKEAAKDANVKLIPEDKNGGRYHIDVTLSNGKPLSYYGKLLYTCDCGDDEPFINVFFSSYTMANKDNRNTINDKLTEWRKNEYGRQYDIIYGESSNDEIMFIIKGLGYFGHIPAVPSKHSDFNYDEILKRGGQDEADKRFYEFLVKKSSGYTTVMIKSLEHSIACGHKWPRNPTELKREYPIKMKKILENVAERKGWILSPKSEYNYFHLKEYNIGSISIRYSSDFCNPTVDIEFISLSFDDEIKADHAGDEIVKSPLAKELKVFVVNKIAIKLKKTVAIQNINDEEECIVCIQNEIQNLINSVVAIRDNVQKFPTEDEVEARRKEQEARIAQLQAEEQSTSSYSSSRSSNSDKEDSERRARERKEEAERRARERQAEADHKKREKERIEREKDKIRRNIEQIEWQIRNRQRQIADMQLSIKHPNKSANAKKSTRADIANFRRLLDTEKERLRKEKERLRAVK